jgi:hypothetical protein
VIGGRRVSTVDAVLIPVKVTYANKQVQYLFDREVPLKTHIGIIVEKLALPGNAQLYALFHVPSNSFLKQEVRYQSTLFLAILNPFQFPFHLIIPICISIFFQEHTIIMFFSSLSLSPFLLSLALEICS